MSESPGTVLQRLLVEHSELRSSHAQARHDYQLAAHMEEVAALRARELVLARDAFEGERHRVDPRRRRQLHFGVGVFVVAVVLVVMAAGLGLQLKPAHITDLIVLAIIGAAGGTGIAWRAGVAWREQAKTALLFMTTGALVGVLLTVGIHIKAALAAGQPSWKAIGVAALLGLVLAAALVVVGGVAKRLEPLAVARLRARTARARQAYEEQHALLLEDRQRARTERGRFLGLVRAELGPDVDDVIQAEVIALAEALFPDEPALAA